MEYAHNLNGGIGAPFIARLQADETLANAGIPVLETAAGNGGVSISTTTGWAKAAGMTLSTVTSVTAQQTDGTSTERYVEVIISPHAVFRALMSGGATEGTALDLKTVTTASTSGLDVITGDAFTDLDDGAIWGFDGANAGQIRNIIVGDGTDATVKFAFDQDTVVGDNFLACPWWPAHALANQIQTTTNLYQADASVAGSSGAEARIVSLDARDNGGEGRTNSYVLFIFDDHCFGQPGT